jgi:hypothetical protein
MRAHAVDPAETRPAEAGQRRGRRALPRVVEEELRRAGRPLDAAVRAEMERILGHDLGEVRIHADTGAAEAAGALGAAAFTAGGHVVFGQGRYQPETAEGRRLLAHELAHTVQQTPAPEHETLAGPARGGGRGPLQLEREAVAAADRAAAGERVPPGLVSVSTPLAHDRVALQPLAEEVRAPVEVPATPEALSDIAADVERALTFDPDDVFGRARHRLAGLAPTTRQGILAQLGQRLPDAQRALLAAIVAELAPEVTDPRAALAAADALGEEHAEPEAAREGEVEAPAAARADHGPDELEREGEAPAAEEEKEEAPPTEGEPLVPEAPVETEDAPAEEPQLVAEGEQPQPGGEAEAEAEAAAVEGTDAERQGAPPREGASPEVGDVAPAEAEEDAADAAPAEEVESDALASVEEAEEEAEDSAEEDAPGSTGTAPAIPAAAAPAEVAAEAEEAGPEDPTDEPGPEPASTEPPQVGPEDPADSEDEQNEGAPADEFMDDAVPGPGEEAAEAADLAGGQPEPDTGAENDPATVAGQEAEVGEGGPDTEDAGDPGASEASEEAEAEGEVPAGDDDEGTPIEGPSEAEARDLPDGDPEAALGAVSTLAPAAQREALGGVTAAATGSVDRRHEALAASPPALDRPSGAPSAAERAAEEAEPPAAPGLPKLERLPEADAPVRVGPAPLPPAPAPATQRVATPRLPEGPNGDLSEEGKKALQNSLRALPVHDAGLRMTAGPAPELPLQEGADPGRAETQRAELERTTRAARVDGHRDVVTPMGETELFPDVPPETLRAGVPARPKRAASAVGREAAASAEPLDAQERAESVVATQERGDELRGAAAGARQELAAERASHEGKLAEERQQAEEDVSEIVRENADAQTAERRKARSDVHAERVAWSGEQRMLADTTRKEAAEVTTKVASDVSEKRAAAERESAAHVEQGNRDAEAARRAGEQKAAEERAKGEQEADKGFIGWLADQATELFDSVKKAITDAFEAARAAVRDAIKRAQELATAVIDRARDAIVSAIKLAGAALVALGDKLLAGFPALRDRFRKAIQERVAKAEAAVNALADELKAGVQRALDLLGAALDAVLGLLEKALLFVVDAYRTAIEGALKFAKAALEAFAAFAALIEDISADPLQWIINLGKGAKAGVRKHLWTAFKKAIKRWFSEKVEEVLGLGLTIWNVLKKGGISLAKIGGMAWEAIKAAIPPTLIQILIEKLISLIIPAAGAILLIIEGLQAAWGTIKRVIEAFQRFFVFLKAVRSARSGKKFAEALAAGAIALIDFVANWLLKRLRKPAGKIAKKIRELAKKLGRKLGKAVKGLGKKLKPRKGGKPKRKKQTPDKRAKAQRRVDKATDFLTRQLVRGMPFPILRAQMIYASGVYRVRVRLRDRQRGATLTVEANPTAKTLIEKVKKSKKPPRIGDYIRRVDQLLRYVIHYHDRHHMLPKEDDIKVWWRAIDIDWNEPRNMLLLPPFLHQSGVHKNYRKIKRHLTEAEQKKLVSKFERTWNGHWRNWWRLQQAAGIPSPAYLRKPGPKNEELREKLRRRVAAELKKMIENFSHRSDISVNLNDFRTDSPKGPKYRHKYKQALQDAEAKLKRLQKKKNLQPHEARKVISDFMKGKVQKLDKHSKRVKTRAVTLYRLLGRK